MKTIQLMSLLSLLGLVSCGNGLKGFNEAVAQRAARYEVETFQTRSGKPLAITLIKHGSLEIYYDGLSIQVDPVSGSLASAGSTSPISAHWERTPSSSPTPAALR